MQQTAAEYFSQTYMDYFSWHYELFNWFTIKEKINQLLIKGSDSDTRKVRLFVKVKKYT